MTRTSLIILCLLVLQPYDARHALAQETEGSALAVVTGGALGLVSGGMTGTLGSIIPCAQTYHGHRCVGAVTALGAAVGLTGGILIGTTDKDRIAESAKSAGIGFVIGSAAGLAITPFAQRFGWRDVLTMGALGAAVGAAPRGAAIGLGVGAAFGGVLWIIEPEFGFPNFLGTAVGGLAVGTLGNWIIDGIDARSGSGEGIPLLLPLRLSF